MTGASLRPALLLGVDTFSVDVSACSLCGPAGQMRVEDQVLRLAVALRHVLPEQVVLYAIIAAALWPSPAEPTMKPSASIRAALMKFRRALHATGVEERLRTVSGTGVRLVEPAAPEDVARQVRRASIPIGLDLDPMTDVLRHAARTVAVTRFEAALLRALLPARGPVPRAELLLMLYDGRSPPAGAGGVVPAKLTHLRRKLEAVGIPLQITAHYRAGYMLDARRQPGERKAVVAASSRIDLRRCAGIFGAGQG